MVTCRWTPGWMGWLWLAGTSRFASCGLHWKRSCTCFRVANQHCRECWNSASALTKTVLRYLTRWNVMLWLTKLTSCVVFFQRRLILPSILKKDKMWCSLQRHNVTFCLVGSVVIQCNSECLTSWKHWRQLAEPTAWNHSRELTRKN